MSQQLEIPLFPPDIMEKVKAGHALMEMEKLRKEIEHVKHQRDGYHGALTKIQKQLNPGTGQLNDIDNEKTNHITA